METVLENSVINSGDNGRGSAHLVYILYIVGFFTAITALIGVIFAYVNRKDAGAQLRSHYDFQIKIFWRGVVFLTINTILYMIVSIVGAATLGIGFVLMILPLGILIWWFVWTAIAIAKGMKALGRNEGMA